MKEQKVKAEVLSNEGDTILIVEFPDNQIKTFTRNGEVFEEETYKKEFKSFDEAIKKVKEYLEIDTERMKVFASTEFELLPFEKAHEVEEAFDERIAKVWA